MSQPAGDRQAFEQIFWQLPDRQNRFSSSWWFFLLFPDGEEGYGPEQLMFAVASRTGESITLNGRQYTGMDLDRPVSEDMDRFNAVSFGWYTDGTTMHEDVIHRQATAQLSRGTRLDAMKETPDGVRGTEIHASDDPLGMDVHIVGDDGEARFEAWGETDSLFTTPQEATDIETGPVGAHLVNWPRMRFEGTFDLPDGEHELEGICYFQRVCLNVPLFPWKWMCAYFPDGSTFLGFVPYLGPQLLRRGYTFFSDGREQATISLDQEAQWEWGGSGRNVELDRLSIEPEQTDGHPRFRVRACNDQGDALSFIAEPYGHVMNKLNRSLLGVIRSHYTHNEYPVRITDLEGRIEGQELGEEMGQGFGNLEYTWGLGL